MSRRAWKEAGNIFQIISNGPLEAEKLRRHMKEVDGSKQLLKSTREKALAAEGFAKKNVRPGSGSLLSGACFPKRVFWPLYGNR